MAKLSSFFSFKDDSSFIGYITELNFNQAKILSHDYHSSQVNFIPQNAFLIASLEDSKSEIFAFFLLRVENISYIDNQTKLNKEATVQKITSPEDKPINIQKQVNDPINQNKLSFYQLECKILGTFYLDQNNNIQYGNDAYSFNVSHLYKVYKPTGENLEKIVNFIKKDRLLATQALLKQISNNSTATANSFHVGNVRYASTIFNPELEQTAKVFIDPADFIKQKTGIFGMTRTGKSNTLKIIVQSIMNLSKNLNTKIGQIIYDINGEYANDNEQNKQITNKNLYTIDTTNLQNNFTPALNNFYLNPNYGLRILQEGIKSKEKGSNYLNVFYTISQVNDDPLLFLLWISLLTKANYPFPTVVEHTHITPDLIYYQNKKFNIKINDELRQNLDNLTILKYFQVQDGKEKKPQGTTKHYVLTITEQSLVTFTKQYLRPNLVKNESGQWVQKEHDLYKLFRNLSLDNELHYYSLLGLILQEDRTGGNRLATSGWQLITDFQFCHCQHSHHDYRATIYDKLKSGETVIIDFSIGDPFTRKHIADELMEYIFIEQNKIFKTGTPSPIINIFIEEAHNVIGKGVSDENLWARVAKEGAKYNIGVIYATQEPSAISESMLANTANFIVSHLNNEKEINTISQYEDIGDFKQSIQKTDDVGFVRLRLLSKPYTIPVQIKKFE